MNNEIKNYPTWLEGHIKNIYDDDRVSLCSSSENELLEIWYCGDLCSIKGYDLPFIVGKDKVPVLVKAKDPVSGEEFVVFDYAKHGYDGMFCECYDDEILKSRTADKFKKYDIPPSKLFLDLEYSIDYDDEKDDYDFDDDGMVILFNEERMSWEDVKRNGIAWISMSFENENGDIVEIMNFELA